MNTSVHLEHVSLTVTDPDRTAGLYMLDHDGIDYEIVSYSNWPV